LHFLVYDGIHPESSGGRQPQLEHVDCVTALPRVSLGCLVC